MFNPDDYAIRPEVRAFFKNSFQDLDENWSAGEVTLASDIFICGSPIDAICFLHLNYQKFNRIEQLFFVCLGKTPSKKKSKQFCGARYHLIFPNDLLGHVADLKFACWLTDHRVWMEVIEGKLKINFRYKEYLIDQQIFTLNRFERKSGYRFGVRTHKPKTHNTFFEQLQHGN